MGKFMVHRKIWRKSMVQVYGHKVGPIVLAKNVIYYNNIYYIVKKGQFVMDHKYGHKYES